MSDVNEVTEAAVKKKGEMTQVKSLLSGGFAGVATVLAGVK